MTRKQKAERQEAIERLREVVKPGDTIYCILRSVSRSGMSRVIDLKVMGKGEDTGECRMWHIGYNAALATESPYDRQREGVKMGGCGMDMGFALVDHLGYALWPEGWACTGKDCQHPGHSNNRRQGLKDQRGEGVTHKGYALKHSWL